MPDVTDSNTGNLCLLASVINDPSLHARQTRLTAGAVLYEPDAAPKAIFYIEQGEIRSYQIAPDGTSRLLEIVGPGEWVGAAALANVPAYGKKAVAVTNAVVWEIPAESLLEFVCRRPEAARDVIRHLSMKLWESREDAARLTFDDCNQRLVKTLVRFSRTVAAQPNGDGVVLRITHEQLAQAVGAARETVSLALSQLRRKKLLKTGRNSLSFNPQTLESAAMAALPVTVVKPTIASSISATHPMAAMAAV